MDANDIFKIRKTLFEMLEDRHFNIDIIKNNITSLKEINAMYDNNNVNFSDEKNNIYIHFFLDKKSFGKKDLENIVKSNIDYEYILIIIPDQNISAVVLKELSQPTYNGVEIFQKKQLITNITKHVLQPKFRLLSKDEIEKIMENYRVEKLSYFAKIKTTDPISKYYGAKKGDLFEIIRNSESNGEKTIYKLVI